MTFQQLEYLLKVNQIGSFSKAAQALFVTQSTISNAILALEAEVGCQIFFRGNAGLTPTPRGEEVIAHAKRICESHQYILSSERPTKTQVRIGSVNYAPANRAFIRLMEENKSRPDVTFSFIDSRSGGLTNKLLSCELDVAISFTLSPYNHLIEERYARKKLHCQKLTVIPVAVCIGPGHRLYHKAEVTPQDLSNEKLLEMPGTPKLKTGALTAYLPLHPENVVIACNASLRNTLLREGYVYAIGHLPSQEERANSDLRYIPIQGLYYSVFIATDPTRPPSENILRYIELLKEEISRTP